MTEVLQKRNVLHTCRIRGPSSLVEVKPNVLLVVLDAARRDALAPYAAAAAATPTIGELARRGSWYANAYATSSWTLPSHGSMLTGLLPRTLGVGQAETSSPEAGRAAIARHADRLLARVLAAAGYDTRGFSANLFVSGHFGFDAGFAGFDYVASGRTARIDALTGGGRRARLAWALEGLRSREDDGAAELGRRLRDSIAAWSGRPTLWFANVVECHSPYLPPRPWDDLGPRERVRAALDAQRYVNFEAICRHVAGAQRIPAESLERMRHLYARSVAYMDAWLADVLEALSQRGILDETLVIVTSDHGESFDEAGLIAHGFGLDQRLIRVPLVLAGPGASGGDQVFSLASLPALIAGAAGLPQHPWDDAEAPAGTAIAQYDAIAAAEDPRVVEFARRFGIGAAGITRLTASFETAVDGRGKLLRSDAYADVGFDLEADPDERAPLPRDAGFGGLAAALDGVAGAGAAGAALDGVAGAAAAAPGTAPSGGPSPEELAALEQQMRLLGYL